MNAKEVFTRAYAATHQAADEMSRLEARGDAPSVIESHQVLKNLRVAVSAWTQLDSLIAGNPAPKRGE